MIILLWVYSAIAAAVLGFLVNEVRDDRLKIWQWALVVLIGLGWPAFFYSIWMVCRNGERP